MDATEPTFPLPPDFPDRAAFEAEWCAALRSGEYEQARTQLRHGDRRCCLGVACDIAIRHGVGQWLGNAYVSPGQAARKSVLPFWLANHLGIDRDGAPKESLASLNDRGVPFVVIAGVIDGSVPYADAEKLAVRR